MTYRYRDAVRKLDHAIDHLNSRAGRMPPLIVKRGQIDANVSAPDHMAVAILAAAMCDVVREGTKEAM